MDIFLRLVLVTVIFGVCNISVNAVIDDSFKNGGQGTGTRKLHYSRDFLMSFNAATDFLPDNFKHFPVEIRKTDDDNHKTDKRHRRRGCRGGVRRRIRRDRNKLPLPTVILANVRSMRPN